MLIVYKTGKQFVECNEFIFQTYPLETLLFLNVAQKMKDDLEGFVVKVTNGPVFLMAIQYKGMPMLLCGNKTLCSELAVGLFESEMIFNRVLAEQDLAESFLFAYERVAGGIHNIVHAVDIMFCKQLEKASIDTVEPALPEDAKEISGLLTKFYKEAFHPLGEEKQTLRNIKAAIDRFALIREDGKIVSLAQRSGETKSICGISSLYTVEGCRRRGMAQKVATYLTQSIVQRKKVAYVFLDQQDVTAHQLYQRMGYIQGIPQSVFEIIPY